MNYPAIVLGLFGLVVMALLVVVSCCAHSVNPAFVAIAGVVGALMGGELVLIGMGKSK